MAVHLTLVATTEQRAGGCLGGREWALESVVRGSVEKQMHESRPRPDPTRRGGCLETGSGGLMACISAARADGELIGLTEWLCGKHVEGAQEPRADGP